MGKIVSRYGKYLAVLGIVILVFAFNKTIKKVPLLADDNTKFVKARVVEKITFRPDPTARMVVRRLLYLSLQENIRGNMWRHTALMVICMVQIAKSEQRLSLI